MFTATSSADVRPEPRYRIFLSRWYPGEQAQQRIIWDYWLRNYALLAILVLLVVISRLYLDTSILVIALAGMVLAGGVAYLVAILQLQRRLAVMLFEGNSFRLFTLYEWLYQQDEIQPFPCSYAAAVPTQQGLQLHFHDRVVMMKQENWPDLNEIYQELVRPI